MSRRPFEDEEPLPPPIKKPQGMKPMGKTHRLLAKGGALVAATLVWSGIKNNLQETKGRNISTMQLQAGEEGRPMVIDTTSSTITAKVAEVITGKEEPKNTVIINPPGQEPAVQVITPDATITANKTGEVETITPKENTQEKPLTPTEAKKTVDTALKDAAEKTIPKEESATPLTPKKD